MADARASWRCRIGCVAAGLGGGVLLGQLIASLREAMFSIAPAELGGLTVGLVLSLVVLVAHD